MANTPQTEPHDDVDAWGMNAATRAELQRDDKDAWKHVVGLLLTIVSVGLVLALLTVWLSS